MPIIQRLQIWLLLLVCSVPVPIIASDLQTSFTAEDIKFLSTFTLDALPALPFSLSNQYTDNKQAAKLGHALFFDQQMSANGEVSCATCHQPEKYFTDGLKTAKGIGITRRNTISLIGVNYGPWKYWDGRKDSVWSQALEPIEAAQEHGFSRLAVYQLIAKKYRAEYEQVFGAIGIESADSSTKVLVNVGKSLMAYQRQLIIPPSRFDRYVTDLKQGKAGDFTVDEVIGMRLFMGKAACASCHNGPLFSNFEFHNIGVPEANKEQVDLGRYAGIASLRADEFNCLSRWSDAKSDECIELKFLKKQGAELVGAFKTPMLRNVAETAPYMHAGQLASLDEVVQHYNIPTPPFYSREQHPFRPHFDVLPLRLDLVQLNQLVAFLKTLSSAIPEDSPWWQPPADQKPD